MDIFYRHWLTDFITDICSTGQRRYVHCGKLFCIIPLCYLCKCWWTVRTGYGWCNGQWLAGILYSGHRHQVVETNVVVGCSLEGRGEACRLLANDSSRDPIVFIPPMYLAYLSVVKPALCLPLTISFCSPLPCQTRSYHLWSDIVLLVIALSSCDCDSSSLASSLLFSAKRAVIFWLKFCLTSSTHSCTSLAAFSLQFNFLLWGYSKHTLPSVSTWLSWGHWVWDPCSSPKARPHALPSAVPVSTVFIFFTQRAASSAFIGKFCLCQISRMSPIWKKIHVAYGIALCLRACCVTWRI